MNNRDCEGFNKNNSTFLNTSTNFNISSTGRRKRESHSVIRHNRNNITFNNINRMSTIDSLCDHQMLKAKRGSAFSI